MIIKKCCEIKEFVPGNVVKRWLKNGKPHREGSYAIEIISGPHQGTKTWMVDGHNHREDGAAIEFNNGKKAWFLNGREYTKEAFEIEMNARNLLKGTDKVRGFSKYILDVSI